MTAFQRATATVDLGAVERNCQRLIRELGPQTALCAVVKANGYGHGIAECAAAAIEGGASWIAVAAATEAFEVRHRFQDPPILTMGALTDPEIDVALRARSDIGVSDAALIATLAERGEQFGFRPRIHIKYDTGMGRLGERDPDVVRALLEQAASDPRVELIGLWTHFATADQPDSEFFAIQLERFLALSDAVAGDHPGLIRHAANSAATLRAPASHLDMVRCGVAIYGLDPFGVDPARQDLEPALELSSYVTAIKRFEAGASAGYGQRWSAPAETMIGVLPIGYGDGVSRGLSRGCDVLIGGRRYPVVGTISMDNITVDLGADPTGIEIGAEAVLLGRQGEERISAEDWARQLDTINYEITCGVSPRVTRSYRR